MPYEHLFLDASRAWRSMPPQLALMATLLLSGAGTADGAAPDGPRADTAAVAATTPTADTAETGTPLRDDGIYPAPSGWSTTATPMAGCSPPP